MKRVAVVGGETHIGEVTGLAGELLQIVGCAVREDQLAWARQTFGCPVGTDYRRLVERDDVDIVSVANENDRRAEVILSALAAGKDVIADKPIAITLQEQEAIERALVEHPQRRLLMLLTLRGQPLWAGLRQVVQEGRIGVPAFTHVRMAVRLKRQERPPWFLDVRRSGGLFVDLLVHALDQVEWITGRRVVRLSANMGNLGDPADEHLRDHAAVYCLLDDGSAALCEGQRMLPDTCASDYRALVAGTEGFADLAMAAGTLTVTDPRARQAPVVALPPPTSVVRDWLAGGELVAQAASLRANRLAVLATVAAQEGRSVAVA
ncbi:MAG: Gfo/Idh/MocA family protein [Armatimonadota bacterium]